MKPFDEEEFSEPISGARVILIDFKSQETLEHYLPSACFTLAELRRENLLLTRKLPDVDFVIRRIDAKILSTLIGNSSDVHYDTVSEREAFLAGLHGDIVPPGTRHELLDV